MSELFAPLRDPDVVPAQPPEAVRRRGDRLRRRRTALQVLASGFAVVVVLAGGFWASGGSDSGSSPGPADSTDPAPAELDLADGMPRGNWSSQIPELVVCGSPYPEDDSVTVVHGASLVDGGDVTARTLAVYPDAGAARSAATALVDRYRSCPRSTDRRRREVVTTVRRSEHGDRGWVVEQQWNAPGSGVDFPQVVQVVQAGATVLVVRQSEVHGIRLRDLATGTSVQVEWLLDHQVCLFDDGGCAWRSDPDVLRPDGWGPLRLGMTRDEVEVTGADGFRDVAGGCTAADLGPGTGLLSDEGRLVSLQVPEGVATPDGIGIGSSMDDVSETYWFGEQPDGGVLTLRASPDTDYVLTLEGRRVTGLALSMVDAECVTPAGGVSRR